MRRFHPPGDVRDSIGAPENPGLPGRGRSAVDDAGSLGPVAVLGHEPESARFGPAGEPQRIVQRLDDDRSRQQFVEYGRELTRDPHEGPRRSDDGGIRRWLRPIR